MLLKKNYSEVSATSYTLDVSDLRDGGSIYIMQFRE